MGAEGRGRRGRRVEPESVPTVCPGDPRRQKKAEELVLFVCFLRCGIFAIPSQSGSGEYRVNLKELSCTYVDFQKRGMSCKHILAARLAVEKEMVRNVL